MDSDSDESDLYAALADSERIVNGSVSLDLDSIKSRKSVTSIQTSLSSLADKEGANHSQSSVSAIKARFERVSTISTSNTISTPSASNNSTLNSRKFSRADKISTPSLLSHTLQPSPKRQSASTPDVKNPPASSIKRGSNARKHSYSENDDYNTNLVANTAPVPNNTQTHRNLLTSTESLSNFLFDDDPTVSHPPAIRQKATTTTSKPARITTSKAAPSQNLNQTMTPSEEYLFNFMSNTTASSTEPTRIPLNDTFISTDSVNIAAPIVQSAIRRNTLMDAPEERRNPAAIDRSTGSLYDYDYGHQDEIRQAGLFAGESEERLSESHNNIALSSASLNAIARNEFMSNAGFKRASMGEQRASFVKIQPHQQSNRPTAASQDIIPQHQSHNNNAHLASKQNQISSPSSRNKVSFSQEVGMNRNYQEAPVNQETRDSASFWDVYHETDAADIVSGSLKALNPSTLYLNTAPHIPKSNIGLPQVQIEQYVSDQDLVHQQSRNIPHPSELQQSQHHFEQHQNQGLQQVRSSQANAIVQPVTTVPTPDAPYAKGAPSQRPKPLHPPIFPKDPPADNSACNNVRKVNTHQPTTSAPDFSFEKLRSSIGTGTPVLRNSITKPVKAHIIHSGASAAVQQELSDVTIENSETPVLKADTLPIAEQAHPKVPAGCTFNNCKFEYALPSASVAASAADILNRKDKQRMKLGSMDVRPTSRDSAPNNSARAVKSLGLSNNDEQETSAGHPSGADLTLSDLSTDAAEFQKNQRPTKSASVSESVPYPGSLPRPYGAASLKSGVSRAATRGVDATNDIAGSSFGWSQLSQTSAPVWKGSLGSANANRRSLISNHSQHSHNVLDSRHYRQEVAEADLQDVFEMERSRHPQHRLPEDAALLKKKRAPISFRPTEALLRKKHQDLDHVNAELVHLSHLLSDKRAQLKLREAALEIREARIAEAQERIEIDVQDLLTKRLKDRDASLKKEMEAIIFESDTSLAVLAKENRRLVVSNKELAAANRRLRDQSRQMMEAIRERDVRELELHNHIKQQKERIDRLKTNLSSVKPSNLVIERAPVTPLLYIKRAHHGVEIESKGKQPMRTATTQTVPTCILTAQEFDASPKKVSDTTPELMDVILVLLRTHFMMLQITEENSDPLLKTSKVLDGIFQTNSAEISTPLMKGILKLSAQKTPSDEWAVLISLLATYMFEFTRSLDVSCAVRAAIAQSAFEICATQSTLENMPFRAQICLQLISLAAFSPDSKHGFEDILSQLTATFSQTDEAKRLFASLNALDFLCPTFISEGTRPTVKFLSSSLLLTMCGDGDWREVFMQRCLESEFLMDAITTSFTTALSRDSLGTYENLSTLLQQLSLYPSVQMALRNNTVLYTRLKELDSTDDPNCEFLRLNIRSVLHNLSELNFTGIHSRYHLKAEYATIRTQLEEETEDSSGIDGDDNERRARRGANEKETLQSRISP
ncbi:hypothetical protein CcCBS67573_g07698 [Chytriomyces confervae]|uniref:Coiled-coil domain-containing protein n=1 Tax=Chytriomyces confervae TaxID=246404 RepID=A0A507ERU3_9FUNG|nr:hypothetical protein CcCBS67573_g07698 [Chytriomyces confervae]